MNEFLIWSHEHGAWWKPAGWGYTGEPTLAGRFTAEKAQEICAKAAFDWHGELPPEVMVPAPRQQVVDVLMLDELDAVLQLHVREVTRAAVAAKARRAAEGLDERMAAS